LFSRTARTVGAAASSDLASERAQQDGAVSLLMIRTRRILRDGRIQGAGAGRLHTSAAPTSGRCSISTALPDCRVAVGTKRCRTCLSAERWPAPSLTSTGSASAAFAVPTRFVPYARSVRREDPPGGLLDSSSSSPAFGGVPPALTPGPRSSAVDRTTCRTLRQSPRHQDPCHSA
jgi:hypothetical protein